LSLNLSQYPKKYKCSKRQKVTSHLIISTDNLSKSAFAGLRPSDPSPAIFSLPTRTCRNVSIFFLFVRGVLEFLILERCSKPFAAPTFTKTADPGAPLACEKRLTDHDHAGGFGASWGAGVRSAIM
jgi:hypothetical protein